MSIPPARSAAPPPAPLPHRTAPARQAHGPRPQLVRAVSQRGSVQRLAHIHENALPFRSLQRTIRPTAGYRQCQRRKTRLSRHRAGKRPIGKDACRRLIQNRQGRQRIKKMPSLNVPKSVNARQIQHTIVFDQDVCESISLRI